MIADLTVFPVGSGTSLSDYVAEVLKIIEKSGLNYELHSMGTNVEGEFDDIVNIVKECHEKLKEMGCGRITSTIKFDDRIDKTYPMRHKVDIVKQKAK